MSRFFALIFFGLLFFRFAAAQAPDSLTAAGVADSLAAPPAPAKITLHPFNESFSPIDAHDSSAADIFRFSDLIRLNYAGCGDVFRFSPLFRVTDFNDPGLPRFVSGLNLYPRQTGLYFEGYPLNDPVNGLYNLRFISPDAIRRIEAGTAPLTRDASAQGVDFIARSLTPKEPYTRLMYREGDFGYVDLDIEFAKRYGDRLGVQLGGINKYYDPLGYHGYAFRGIIHSQISARLYARTRFLLNRELVRFIPRTGSYLTRRREERDDAVQDFFFRDADSASGFWQVRVAASSSRRHLSETLSDAFNLFVNFDRYDFSLRRRWRRASWQLDQRVAWYQNRVWGNTFYRRYVDSGFSTHHALDWRFGNSLRISPALELAYREGFDPLILPAFNLQWGSNTIAVKGSFSRNMRFPNRNELSFSRPHLIGNAHLLPEIFTVSQAEFAWRPAQAWHFAVQVGHQKIEREITFTDTTFNNGASRAFDFISFRAEYEFSKFKLQTGGQANNSTPAISPPASFWLRLGYHDAWLNGKVIIDANAYLTWRRDHLLLDYQPQLEYFYLSNRHSGSYWLTGFKIVATVKTAQIFLAMDNPFATQYQIVYGYPEYYRRTRVGVNWVLWN
ncbi:MAG TPA: hypothetical protein ENJ89_00160 [Caldithrix abyssi]|uniref:TonB-dependent receptor n=1 Tax=Caldithrix abyssi TaxID=187145 RepID=A0A7V5PM91_CALAY|nr:hypothetical protein [Caldithrix abyssi]